MIKKLSLAVLTIISSAFLSGADTLPVIDSAKTVVPAGLTPLYENPVPGGLPLSYLEPIDTCHIDSARFDTTNTEWVFVRSGSRSGWLRKSSVQSPFLPPGSGLLSRSRETKLDADAKRRYRIVEQHPEWDRRIVKAVRDGTICLDMSEIQLVGSWGEPFQKGAAFILGAGKQELWLYKSFGGKVETVFLIKGRVVGWSE